MANGLFLMRVARASIMLPALWLIIDRAGRVIGQIEKRPDTRTVKRPWLAYHGNRLARRYVGSFHGPGGREKAIRAAVRGS